MAKRKSNRSRRDTNVVATRRVHAPRPSLRHPAVTIAPVRSVTPPSVGTVRDGRVWHPEGEARPAYDILERPVPIRRLVDRPKPTTSWSQAKSPRKAAQARSSINRYGPSHQMQTKALVAFERPPVTDVCTRRQERKRVLHAKGKAGGLVKRPRRSKWSSFSCR